MIGLVDYLKESRKYNYPTDKWQTLESFLEVNNISEASEDDLNWYAKYVCDGRYYNNRCMMFTDISSPINQIDEMLTSSTFSMIKKELNITLNKNNKYPINRDKTETEFEQGERTVNTICVSTEIFDLEKIMNICDTFMWKLNSFAIDNKGHFNTEGKPYHFENNKGYYIKLRIEPIQSTNCNNYVFNNCKGVIYHVCKEKDLQSIKKSGLRMKGSKNKYRKIEDKVFFCCGENKEILLNTLKIVMQSKGYWDVENNQPLSHAIILKVDVNNYNVHFYEDTYYNKDNVKTIYSYAYFPPKMIKEINFEDLK